MTFYKIYSGLGLLISKAHGGTYIAISNDSSSLIPKPNMRFPSSKSNCANLNKSHVISVTWFDKRKNLSYIEILRFIRHQMIRKLRIFVNI